MLQAAPTVTKSINQTASFTNYYPIFLNIEVKYNYINKDLAIQLAAQIVMEFQKQQLEGWPLFIPVFAVKIQTNTQLLHIVTAKEILKKPDKFNMFFLGPLRLRNTYSINNTKRLFNNLYNITLWGQNKYKLWFKKEILLQYNEYIG